jgi:hypothetical protein
MRRLRKTDSAFVHRRAARYHIVQCRLVSDASHTDLADLMQPRYANLVARTRAVEEAFEQLTDATARADAAEIQLENVIRDTDGVLARLDRENPTLNARRTVFPEGFTPVIHPEKRAQLDTLPQLRSDLDRFAEHEAVAAQRAALDAAEARFRQTLQAEESAEEQVELATIAEHAARRDIREQMQVSFGRLGTLYKSQPQRVEQFFLRQRGQPKEMEGKEDEGKAEGQGKAQDKGKAEGGSKADGVGAQTKSTGETKAKAHSEGEGNGKDVGKAGSDGKAKTSGAGAEPT